MDELSSRQVLLQDRFWSTRSEVNARRAIFHQWAQLEASGCIDNFRIAAGDKDGLREGWFFADSDAYKWLDAAARICGLDPTPQLSVLVEDFIALLARAQAPDGYLFTYNQIHFPGTRWTNLQIEHELYCHGHLIEAGVSHGEATGQSTLLDIARRAADLLVRDFAGAGPVHTPGHEEIEIALLRLYGATAHPPYLQLARHFLEQRGRTRCFGLSLARQMRSSAGRRDEVRRKRQTYLAARPEYGPFKVPPGNVAVRPPGVHARWLISALSGKYFQQHAPVRRQTVPVGHAVRFGYLQTACAMLHRAGAGDGLLPAVEQVWERMVTRRMYVTGGIGSLPELEGFGRDFELDPVHAYAETCAALACVFWNWQMALSTGDARYSDLLEWQLYNAAAVGMGLNGDAYLYNNPLACRGGVTRKSWYAVPCCPSNLSRTFAELGRYVYSIDGGDLYVHQWFGSRSRLQLEAPMEVTLLSGLPWEGRASLHLSPERPTDFCVHLRVPSWSAGRALVRVNGEEVAVPAPGSMRDRTASGYDPRAARWLAVRRTWSPGDAIEVEFDTAIALRRAHPKVRGHAGKMAMTRGPLVYCIESVDNPGLDLFAARIDPLSLHAEYAAGLLGGTMVLRGQADAGRSVVAIPYALWGNRGESQMAVWVNSDVRDAHEG